MYIFIMSFLIILCISFCMRKNFSKMMLVVIVGVISCLISVTISSVYFGVNYNKIPTFEERETYSNVVVDSIKMYDDGILLSYEGNNIKNDSIIVIETTDSISSIVLVKKKFKMENYDQKLFLNFLPTKFEYYEVKLIKKDYELLQAFKAYNAKRESAL